MLSSNMPVKHSPHSPQGHPQVITADRLAQLVERRTAVRVVSGSSPRPGLKITEENMLTSANG